MSEEEQPKRRRDTRQYFLELDEKDYCTARFMCPPNSLNRLPEDAIEVSKEVHATGELHGANTYNRETGEPTGVSQETRDAEDQARKDARPCEVKRGFGYLPIREQLDMLYWDTVNGTTNWLEHVAKVKKDIPKDS